MKYKRLGLGVVAAMLAVVNSGCGMGGMSAEDINELPLVPQLTESEIIDYYKKALNYDTIASRNVNKYEVTYETFDVTDKTKREIVSLVANVQKYLSANQYRENDYISEYVYNYMKAFLNDLELKGAKVVEVKEALDFYFCDIEYDIAPFQVGSLKPASSLLGINGAFAKDVDDKDYVDKVYLKKAIDNINKYYEEKGLKKKIIVSGDGSKIVTQGNMLNLLSSKKNSTTIVPASIKSKEDLSLITPQVDTVEFNKLSSSIKQSAYMPDIDLVFSRAKGTGGISGIGINPSANSGMSTFDIDRGALSGKAKIRYVFKKSAQDGKLQGYNVYPISYSLDTGINKDSVYNKVPDFLLTEFDKVVDRSDRALVNADLSALMSGRIYSDTRIAVLRGYEDEYTEVPRILSKVNKVVARDVDRNAFLIEVETMRQEGAKETDTFGYYKDISYYVIEQLDNQFIITDTLRVSREMVEEPSINPESAILKRIIALNLAGEVTDEAKAEIEKLMTDLYQSGTRRQMSPSEDGALRGINGCFNTDPTILATTKRDYIISQIVETLIRGGVETQAQFSGRLVEWIGGADNQVEFIAEETVQYSNNTPDVREQVYYLVSNIGGNWVIDDRKIIDTEDNTDNMDNGQDVNTEVQNQE